MKILSRVIDRVKSVYQYEKTTHIDAGAIQNVMIIFVIVMMLINIQNFRLGEYFVTALTLVVSGISIFAILALGYSDKIYVILRFKIQKVNSKMRLYTAANSIAKKYD